MTFLRPLGAPVAARVLRFHADDPPAVVAAWGWARRRGSGNVTVPSSGRTEEVRPITAMSGWVLSSRGLQVRTTS